MEKYPIIEIFESVQGEGRFIGMPVTFIRFAGCNLSCPWCDTEEQLKGKHDMLTAEEIVDRVKRSTVVFTGGEPTLYKLRPICDLLDKKFGGCMKAIETNGTNYVPRCIDFIACSPKPQSGYTIHSSIISRETSGAVDYKYVADCALTLKDIRVPKLGEGVLVFIQPEFYSGAVSVARARDLVYQLESKCDVRLGIQAHKYWEVR